MATAEAEWLTAVAPGALATLLFFDFDVGGLHAGAAHREALADFFDARFRVGDLVPEAECVDEHLGVGSPGVSQGQHARLIKAAGAEVDLPTRHR